MLTIGTSTPPVLQLPVCFCYTFQLSNIFRCLNFQSFRKWVIKHLAFLCAFQLFSDWTFNHSDFRKWETSCLFSLYYLYFPSKLFFLIILHASFRSNRLLAWPFQIAKWPLSNSLLRDHKHKILFYHIKVFSGILYMYIFGFLLSNTHQYTGILVNLFCIGIGSSGWLTIGIILKSL